MSSLSRRDSAQLGSPDAAPPLSQYPFPVHDSPQRATYGQRLPTRRSSTTSSVASIGGVLDTGSAGHRAVTELSQNAISTLLQPPIVRTGLQSHTAVASSGFKPPTQRDIPPVALTNIPHIEARAFQPYIAQVGSLYEAFQRAKQETEGDPQILSREKKESRTEEWQGFLDSRAQRPAHSRSSSITSSVASPLEAPVPKKRLSGKRRAHTAAPLSTIPSVYSDDDFHLENPRTFEIVSEGSEIVRDPSAAPTGKKSLATNAILQEKLSWYMDTVEIHLISSISTASKSFFSALGSLRELHGEAAESIDRIQRLRKDLGKLDKEMAIGGLKVVNFKQRRDNVRQLAEAIMQLEEIVTDVRQCKGKVDKGDFDIALDDIDSVEHLISGRRRQETRDSNPRSQRHLPLRDLRAIRALQGVTEELNSLRYLIGRGYEGRFHTSLLGDLRRHMDSVQPDITLQRWGTAFTRLKPGQRRTPSTFPSYMAFAPELRAELEAEMMGLSRSRQTISAATTFRAQVLKEMKNVIRKQLPSSNDDDNVSTISASTVGGRQKSQQEKSSALARNLRALDAEDSYAMLSKIYTNISEGLRRLSIQVKILLDITSGMGQSTQPEPQGPGRPSERSNPSVSVQAEVQQALDLSSLLGEAVDSAQIQITKVVKVRSQQIGELSLVDFLRFFTLNRLFADECEAISGRGAAALKSVVDGQINDFVYTFSNEQKHEVVEIMDADKWEAKDFGDQDNAILARVIHAGTSDPPAWSETLQIWRLPAQTPNGVHGNVTNDSAITTGKDKVRSATIDEQSFILPESPLAMLRTIERFGHLATGIPRMAKDLAASLVDCLKLFNSRSSQLILGAGATRSAGLKNITTKHLALSSQSLSFVIALIPYVRELFRRHLTSSQAPQVMGDFDKVKRLFQEHQNGIHEKFVDIMSGRASVHVTTMKKINWEDAARNKSVTVSPYMETLSKETGTLQKVLSKHLPEPVVASIMVPVFSSYREQWSRAYQETPVKSVAAKERMLADAQYFQSRLSKLAHADDLGEHLVSVVNAKVVASGSENVKKPSIEIQREDASEEADPKIGSDEKDEVDQQ